MYRVRRYIRATLGVVLSTTLSARQVHVSASLLSELHSGGVYNSALPFTESGSGNTYRVRRYNQSYTRRRFIDYLKRQTSTCGCVVISELHPASFYRLP